MKNKIKYYINYIREFFFNKLIHYINYIREFFFNKFNHYINYIKEFFFNKLNHFKKIYYFLFLSDKPMYHYYLYINTKKINTMATLLYNFFSVFPSFLVIVAGTITVFYLLCITMDYALTEFFTFLSNWWDQVIENLFHEKEKLKILEEKKLKMLELEKLREQEIINEDLMKKKELEMIEKKSGQIKQHIFNAVSFCLWLFMFVHTDILDERADPNLVNMSESEKPGVYFTFYAGIVYHIILGYFTGWS